MNLTSPLAAYVRVRDEALADTFYEVLCAYPDHVIIHADWTTAPPEPARQITPFDAHQTALWKIPKRMILDTTSDEQFASLQAHVAAARL
jgi:hypothetical protein